MCLMAASCRKRSSLLGSSSGTDRFGSTLCTPESRGRDDQGSWSSALHQLVADGVADQPGGRVEVELAQGQGAMGLDGLGADAEEISDLLVGPAFGNELHDGLLTGAQRGFVRRSLGQVG